MQREEGKDKKTYGRRTKGRQEKKRRTEPVKDIWIIERKVEKKVASVWDAKCLTREMARKELRIASKEDKVNAPYRLHNTGAVKPHSARERALPVKTRTCVRVENVE